METFLYPKFEAVKSFNTNKVLPNEPGQLQLFDDLKNSANKQTEDYEHEALVENFETRSIKIFCSPLDISFQQNFMEEHKLTFKKESEKYIDFQEKLLQINSKQSQIKKVLNQETNLNGEVQIEKILRNSSGNLLTNEQSERLIIDLRREDKLHDFIEVILPKIEEQVKVQIIYLANQLWEEYILIQEQNLDYQQTIQFAENFTKESIQKLDEKLNYINFKYFHIESENSLENQIRGQRFKHFHNFVLYLSTTFSLVIGGFFENPYFKEQSNYFKRDHQQGAFSFGSINDDNNDFENDEQDNDQEEDYYRKKKVKY